MSATRISLQRVGPASKIRRGLLRVRRDDSIESTLTIFDQESTQGDRHWLGAAATKYTRSKPMSRIVGCESETGGLDCFESGTHAPPPPSCRAVIPPHTARGRRPSRSDDRYDLRTAAAHTAAPPRTPQRTSRVSHVAHRMSHVARRTSHVARRELRVACRRVACRIRCTSDIARRMSAYSHVAHRMSHVSCVAQ